MNFHLWNIPLGIIAFIVAYSAINVRSVRKHSIKEKGLWRGWLTVNDPDYMRQGVDYHLEVAYGRRKARSLGVGFRLHLGDKGSETPFHFDVYLYWFAIFFSMNTPHMGQIFNKIGRGHKRDISLRTHSGRLWWNLWFDDDMGYDRHHHCDKRRNPWWWPFRNKKYRSWMCLRDGCIDLNPLDVMWGHRYYEYKNLGVYEDDFGVYQFEDDIYTVVFTLQHATRGRRHGPRWARKRTDAGYSVDWDCKTGIPVQNHDWWKGDCTYASAVKIEDPHHNWLGQAHNALQEWVIKERQRNNYRPPVGKIIEVRETEDGIIIEGAIDTISGSELLDAVKKGDVEGMSIGFNSSPKLPKGLEYIEFPQQDEADLDRLAEWEKANPPKQD